MGKYHYETLKANNCDYLALTKYEGGEPVDFVKSDEELEERLNADKHHGRFPVEVN